MRLGIFVTRCTIERHGQERLARGEEGEEGRNDDLLTGRVTCSKVLPKRAFVNILSQKHPHGRGEDYIFGSGGGGSRGSTSAQRARPDSVSARIGNLSQSLKASDVKIAISDNGTYEFVNVGANNLMPGDTLVRGITVQNVGGSPITSISLKASTSGSPVMLSNMSVTIEQCSASGCTPVIDNVLLTDLGPSSDVIYSGKLMPGQSVSYVIRTSMSSNTPNSA